MIKSLCFLNNTLPLLKLLIVPYTIIFGISSKHIILTKGKVKEKDHLKLRYLVQVGPKSLRI